jgi:hypothetical protein
LKGARFKLQRQARSSPRGGPQRTKTQCYHSHSRIYLRGLDGVYQPRSALLSPSGSSRSAEKISGQSGFCLLTHGFPSQRAVPVRQLCGASFVRTFINASSKHQGKSAAGLLRWLLMLRNITGACRCLRLLSIQLE